MPQKEYVSPEGRRNHGKKNETPTTIDETKEMNLTVTTRVFFG